MLSVAVAGIEFFDVFLSVEHAVSHPLAASQGPQMLWDQSTYALTAPFLLHRHATDDGSVLTLPQKPASNYNALSVEGDAVGGGCVGLVQFFFSRDSLFGHENSEPYGDGGFQVSLCLHQFNRKTGVGCPCHAHLP